MGISRRDLLGVGVTLGGVLLLPTEAFATTARKLSLEQLVSASFRISLVNPVEKHSTWETLAGRRAIVTYTRILIEEQWAEGSESEELVRTLGGRVGDIQQKAFGEASLRKGERCLVFLSKASAGARQVIGMAQGHYRVEGQATGGKLFHSKQLPKLVGRGPAAVEALHEKTVAEARAAIRRHQ